MSKALSIRIIQAKAHAVRARANAEKALQAKTNRLNAKLRQQKLREAMLKRRKDNMDKLSSELKAKTAANEEEAEDIWETAKEVVKQVNEFNAAGKVNARGYDTEYIGCFRDRRQRDLPTLHGKYKA